jgi:hypothetical protein
MSESNCPPSGFRFSLINNGDRFMQSMSEFSYMSLMLICCGLTSVACNQGTNEPHMARMLDVAEKCPSNDTNAFES